MPVALSLLLFLKFGFGNKGNYRAYKGL